MQSTAYEMRISGWSSDVCSSDLREIDIPAKDYEVWIIPGIAKHEAIAVHNYYHSGNPNSRAARTTGPILKDKNDRVGGSSISGATLHKWRSLYKENGRASCRESVCQ